MLIEILATRSNADIEQIKEEYKNGKYTETGTITQMICLQKKNKLFLSKKVNVFVLYTGKLCCLVLMSKLRF